MKKLIKLLSFLFIFIAFSAISYMIIFSQNLKFGIAFGFLLLFFCAVLFCIAIFGLVIGNLKFVLLGNRLEVFGLLALSIFLAILIGFFTVANIGLVQISPNLDLEGKTRFVISNFFKVPSQKNLLVEKKDGITYFYSLETEQYINRFHALLLEEKSTFDNFFGSDDLAPLTIEIYDDLKSLNDKHIYLNDIDGYYNENNHSIHLVGEENNWQLVLLHEYTHYRIDQFEKTNDLLSFERLPVWFHEGLSEVMGHGMENFYTGDINHIQSSIQDFNLLDHYDSFHQIRREGHDPYRQSYFAVQSIVDDYGVEALQGLLLSKSIDGFYDNLEILTNKSLDEFQQTFPEKLVATQELINDKFSLAREAMNAKNYSQTETILIDVIYEGNKHNVLRANYELLDLYLEQNLFEEALTQLDILNSNEENGNKTSTLKQQAEIYLLVDTEKALTTIELAKVEVPTDHWMNPIIDELAEAFRLINSDNPVQGYRLLFEEDLFISDKVLHNLHEKLVTEYPEDF
jgi:hypothetical protein